MTCAACGAQRRLMPRSGLCSTCDRWENEERLDTPDLEVFVTFVIAIVDRARKDTVENNEIPLRCACGGATTACAASFLTSCGLFIKDHPEEPLLLVEAIGHMLSDVGEEVVLMEVG